MVKDEREALKEKREMEGPRRRRRKEEPLRVRAPWAEEYRPDAVAKSPADSTRFQ